MSSETITRNDLKNILNNLIPSPSFTDFFYPVGSYYETSDTTFDPNVSWGGTWVLEAAGQVHVSAGTNYTVSGANGADGVGTSDGGSTDVAYHTHTVTRSTNASVTVAAHGITQPNFTIPAHAHNVGSGRSFVTHSSADSATIGETSCSLPGSGYYVPTIKKDDNWYGAVNTASSGGGGTCTRSTNVALTNNHSVTVTQPEFTADYAGTNGNDNMQPYIVVNRWHRTA